MTRGGKVLAALAVLAAIACVIWADGMAVGAALVAVGVVYGHERDHAADAEEAGPCSCGSYAGEDVGTAETHRAGQHPACAYSKALAADAATMAKPFEGGPRYADQTFEPDASSSDRCRHCQRERGEHLAGIAEMCPADPPAASGDARCSHCRRGQRTLTSTMCAACNGAHDEASAAEAAAKRLTVERDVARAEVSRLRPVVEALRQSQREHGYLGSQAVVDALDAFERADAQAGGFS